MMPQPDCWPAQDSGSGVGADGLDSTASTPSTTTTIIITTITTTMEVSTTYSRKDSLKFTLAVHIYVLSSSSDFFICLQR